MFEVLDQHPNDLIKEIWEEIMTDRTSCSLHINWKVVMICQRSAPVSVFREAQMKQKLGLHNHLTFLGLTACAT